MEKVIGHFSNFSKFWVGNIILIFQRFVECEETFDALRARYVERKHKPHEFELFVHFEEYTVRHWALRQQVHHGDITAPSKNYNSSLIKLELHYVFIAKTISELLYTRKRP